MHSPYSSLRKWLWLAAILLGAAQAWTYRFTISSHDAVSYLDIADAYLRGDWQAALNPHWSPLYSWLLAVTLLVLDPTPYWEVQVIQLLNFIIYLCTLLAFDFFLRALIAHNDRQSRRNHDVRLGRVPDWIWIVSGYFLFLWAALKWTPLYSDTPDLATCAFVFLAAGILLRATGGSDGWRGYVLLGVVLGLAYLSKTALLPISVGFLAAALVSTDNYRRTAPRVMLAGLTLAVVSAPFIAALSVKENRFTFGDAGKYVYAAFVNPGASAVPLVHWQGEQPEFGIPEHTTREIHEEPAAFEFATPVPGSYPVWYNPSYWHAGLEIRFNIKRQMRVLLKNLLFAWSTFLGALAFSYLAIILGGSLIRSSLGALKANAVVLVPAAWGLLLYFLATDLPESDIDTQPAMRYIAAFAVLLFAGVVSSARLRDSTESRRWLTGIALAAVVFMAANLILDRVGDRLSARIHGEHVDWQTASALADLGIRSGDDVAHLGFEKTLYWARLAGVRIVAEIPSEEDFWAADPETRAETLRAVRRTGAKVVVAGSDDEKPASAVAEGWRRLGNGEAYVYMFHARH